MITTAKLPVYFLAIFIFIAFIFLSINKKNNHTGAYLTSTEAKKFSTKLSSSQAPYIIQPVYNINELISLKRCGQKTSGKNQDGFCQ